jgi:hypothetical protein
MHDIGRLALAVIRPKEYSIPLGAHSGTPESILTAERELFGWDHCEAGKHLIDEWKLPVEFEPIVAEHHQPRLKNGPWHMIDLIKVSCRMADTIGFPAFPGCEVTPFPELLDELPARERRLFHTTMEPLAVEITRKVNSVEAV